MAIFRRLLFLLSIALVSTWVLRTFFVDAIYVASESMEPTLTVGDHFWVNRLVYRMHEPERGDIIVFTSPVDKQTGFIKRVIAIPGDQIELRHKKVYVNGKLLEEPYTVYKRANEELVGDNIEPMTVPEESVFVLGDNRDLSYDSTAWKDPTTGKPLYFLPMKNIKGRLIQFT